MNTTNWRDIVELKKVFLTGWDDPQAHYYEVVRKRDGFEMAYLDIADDKQQWLADVVGVDGIKSDLHTADDVLALSQAMDYLNRMIALEELTQVSQDMGLYDAQ
jgi:hypothetical protein